MKKYYTVENLFILIIAAIAIVLLIKYFMLIIGVILVGFYLISGKWKSGPTSGGFHKRQRGRKKF